jgi:iron(III) transport system ATP-binding protein
VSGLTSTSSASGGRTVVSGPAAAAAGVSENSVVPRLSVRHATKGFRRRGGNQVQALEDVSIEVAPGQMSVLLGPSGCGKSTLLRCIAGLENPNSGQVVIDGQTVFDGQQRINLPPERRNISMMFQSYAIWPHMTVFQNIEYPMRVRKWDPTVMHDRVTAIAGKMGIGDLLKEYPGQLSGGQQQRVALSRSLVVDPDLVLFDEPLSNVDARVRKRLRVELAAMQREFAFAGVYVTHDQEEALHLADQLVLMRDGRMLQSGSAREVYQRPVSGFAASFLGALNDVAGVVGVASGEGDAAVCDVKTSLGVLTVAAKQPAAVGTDVVVGIRPEALTVTTGKSPAKSAGTSVFPGEVHRLTFLGTHVECLIRAGDEVLQATLPIEVEIAEGDSVWLSVHSSRMLLYSGNADGSVQNETEIRS